MDKFHERILSNARVVAVTEDILIEKIPELSKRQIKNLYDVFGVENLPLTTLDFVGKKKAYFYKCGSHNQFKAIRKYLVFDKTIKYSRTRNNKYHPEIEAKIRVVERIVLRGIDWI